MFKFLKFWKKEEKKFKVYFTPSGLDVHIYLNEEKIGWCQAFSFNGKTKELTLIYLLSENSLAEKIKDKNNIEVKIRYEDDGKAKTKSHYKFILPKKPYLIVGASIDDLLIDEEWVFENVTLEELDVPKD